MRWNDYMNGIVPAWHMTAIGNVEKLLENYFKNFADDQTPGNSLNFEKFRPIFRANVTCRKHILKQLSNKNLFIEPANL